MLIHTTTTALATATLGAKLARRTTPPTHILLFGDLGAGKTCLTQGFCKELGIQARIKSPTYTIMQNYQLADKNIYHYDLYRLHGRTEIDFMTVEEDSLDPKGIMLIEWADRLPRSHWPDYPLVIKLETQADHSRQISFNFVQEKTPNLEEIEKLWTEFQCPVHIVRHMKKVAEVAVEFGKKLIKKGEIINLDLVEKAALIHDLLRIAIIENSYFTPDLADAEPTPQQEEIWEKIKAKYQGLGHEEAAYKLLTKRGYPVLANIIRQHRFDIILNPKELQNWEERLVYYADKRVLHDRQVSLQERFEDSLQRHYQGQTTPRREELIKLNYELEKTIISL